MFYEKVQVSIYAKHIELSVMNNLVDIKSGQIRLNECLFYYKMSFEEACNLSRDLKYELLDFKNEYKRLNLKEIKIGNSFFYFSLCFRNDFLYYIDFGFSSIDELKKTWSDWSEENELSKKNRYEKWLTDNFGERRKFNWGIIETYYDPRGGTTGIILKYK